MSREWRGQEVVASAVTPPMGAPPPPPPTEYTGEQIEAALLAALQARDMPAAADLVARIAVRQPHLATAIQAALSLPADGTPAGPPKLAYADALGTYSRVVALAGHGEAVVAVVAQAWSAARAQAALDIRAADTSGWPGGRGSDVDGCQEAAARIAEGRPS